jgi:hypothetical protein
MDHPAREAETRQRGAHTDIARDFEWMKAILRRDSPTAVLLYVDLFIEGVFGGVPSGAMLGMSDANLPPTPRSSRSSEPN